MIRHEAGQDDLLITQHDHALLAGRLAREIGNDLFAAPDPLEPTLAAISLHDCGWPLHDDTPTLNSQHRPLHVFETPAALSVIVWNASVDGAGAHGDYTGLLVSLHVLRLSDLAVRRASAPDRRAASPRDLFLLNQFQHRQIERQTMLRQRLGLRTDVPLTLGLASPGTSEADDRLRFNAKLLQAMDSVSLALCCSELPFTNIDGVLPRPSEKPLTLHLSRDADRTLQVAPWPFKSDLLEFGIPCRRLEATVYAEDRDLATAYAAAPQGNVVGALSKMNLGSTPATIRRM